MWQRRPFLPHFWVRLRIVVSTTMRNHVTGSGRRWPPPERSRGTLAKKNTQIKNSRDKRSRKMTKLESSGLFLTYQAPGCQDVNAQQWQRSPLLKHTQMLSTHTHTDEQESGCTVICFAITHKMCANCHRGGGWVLQKNLIAKAFICQLLALKSFPAPFFPALYAWH